MVFILFKKEKTNDELQEEAKIFLNILFRKTHMVFSNLYIFKGTLNLTSYSTEKTVILKYCHELSTIEGYN